MKTICLNPLPVPSRGQFKITSDFPVLENVSKYLGELLHDGSLLSDYTGSGRGACKRSLPLTLTGDLVCEHVNEE